MPEEFKQPPADFAPKLAAGAIHVWRARLDPPTDALAVLESTLATDEQQRAARFHFDRDRNRYIAARGTLRRLLGVYTGRAPAQVAFDYGPHGKPALGNPSADAVEFNLAHSGDFALLAFTRAQPVGIDIEQLRDVTDAVAIARSHFTLAETRLLQDARAAERNDVFFRLWTRKESVIKAVGKGLSLPLTEFDVGSTAAPGTWSEVQIATRVGVTWSVRDLATAAGYRGALAVEGPPPDVQLWDADL